MQESGHPDNPQILEPSKIKSRLLESINSQRTPRNYEVQCNRQKTCDTETHQSWTKLWCLKEETEASQRSSECRARETQEKVNWRTEESYRTWRLPLITNRE